MRHVEEEIPVVVSTILDFASPSACRRLELDCRGSELRGRKSRKMFYQRLVFLDVRAKKRMIRQHCRKGERGAVVIAPGWMLNTLSGGVD